MRDRKLLGTIFSVGKPAKGVSVAERQGRRRGRPDDLAAARQLSQISFYFMRINAESMVDYAAWRRELAVATAGISQY